MKRTQTALRWMKLLALGCVLALPMLHAWTQQPPPENILFQERSLSRDISYVQVAEQLNNPFYKSDIIIVQFVGGSPRHLKDLKLQVWLLKTDGTVVKQKTSFGGCTSTGGGCEEHLDFIFEHVPPNEITGLVVQADGKLITRTFAPSDTARP